MSSGHLGHCRFSCFGCTLQLSLRTITFKSKFQTVLTQSSKLGSLSSKLKHPRSSLESGIETKMSVKLHWSCNTSNVVNSDLSFYYLTCKTLTWHSCHRHNATTCNVIHVCVFFSYSSASVLFVWATKQFSLKIKLP